MGNYSNKFNDCPLILLNSLELESAATIGARRYISAMKKGRTDRAMSFNAKSSGWESHIEGAAGEIAAAKLLDIYLCPIVNDEWMFNDGGDTGTAYPIQIKTRRSHNRDLVIKENYNDQDICVLLTGWSTEGFRFRGWILGQKGKREEWFHDFGGSVRTFCVPPHALNTNVSELKDTLQRSKRKPSIDEALRLKLAESHLEGDAKTGFKLKIKRIS